MTPLSGRGAVAGSTGTVLLSTATLPRPFMVSLPLSPVLRSGRVAVVRRRTEWPVPTVAHLHGGKTSPRDDGYPR